MKELRRALDDQASGYALVVLALLLILLQSAVPAAAGLAVGSKMSGVGSLLVICQTSSPTGTAVLQGDDEPRTAVAGEHCTLCRELDVAVLPVPVDGTDLGPACEVSANSTALPAERAERPADLFAIRLAPQPTGPPVLSV